MEDMVDVLRSRTNRLHEEDTESPEFAFDNAKKIVEFIANDPSKADQVKEGVLVINALCVLGAGNDEH